VEATKEVQELLRILEEHGLGEKKFFGGNNIGLVDIAFGWIVACLKSWKKQLGSKCWKLIASLTYRLGSKTSKKFL
jgi:glutathione S-transferase